MKEFLAGAILLLAPFFTGEVSSIKDSELSLSGIAIGDSEEVVLAKLGKPEQVIETGDFLNVEMSYPGLTIWLGEGRVVGEIAASTSAHCTPAGFCPSSSFAKVKSVYGAPVVANRENGQFMEYPSAESACWLQLAVQRGVVRSIRAECQP